MKTVCMAEILKNECYIDNIYDMVLLAPEIAKEAKCGQFVNVYTGQADTLLPRPISICEIDKSEGSLRLVYQVVGKGTKTFSVLKAGDKVKILGPLGNGFAVDQSKNDNVVVGGGIGAPPLLELVKELGGRACVFLGSRSNPILVKEFEALGAEVHVATDDGSQGFHGNVVELMNKIGPKAEAVYACGPKIMLKYAAAWARERGVNPQVSMEERMACGIGACVGCAVKIKKAGESTYSNLKVCKDGPVFLGEEVVWDE